MSNAHGTPSRLLALSLIFGAASMAACDTSDEATRTRRGDDHCKSGKENCEPEKPNYPDDSCVMSHDRWVAQSFAAPEQSPQFTGDLCGMQYDDILTAPNDTPWMKVAQQYVTAQVNVSHGAAMPDDVAAAMNEAESFLSGCTPCPQVTAATEPALKMLTQYNTGTGSTGPDACECVVDCGECVIDCDDGGGIEWCPPTPPLKLRATNY